RVYGVQLAERLDLGPRQPGRVDRAEELLALAERLVHLAGRAGVEHDDPVLQQDAEVQGERLGWERLGEAVVRGGERRRVSVETVSAEEHLVTLLEWLGPLPRRREFGASRSRAGELAPIGWGPGIGFGP